MKRVLWRKSLGAHCVLWAMAWLLVCQFGGGQNNSWSTTSSAARMVLTTSIAVGEYGDMYLGTGKYRRILVNHSLNPRDPGSALTLVGSDGASRKVRSLADVLSVTSLDGTVYTLEEKADPTTYLLQSKLAHISHPPQPYKVSYVIRAYEPDQGTSRTVRRPRGVNRDARVFTSDGNLLVASPQLDRRMAWTMVLRTIEPKSATELTSTVVSLNTIPKIKPDQASIRWLHLYEGGLYFVVDRQSQIVGIPHPADSVYRLDLGSKQLQKVLDDDTIGAICILPDRRALAYVKALPGEDGKTVYRFTLAGLDGSVQSPIVLDVSSGEMMLDWNQCLYDPAASVFLVKAGVYDAQYRVHWSFKEMLIAEN